MRHLIDTYIEADEPRTISPFDNMGLLELITKTGIANAIASQLGGLKGNKDAVAETIENNVRSKIIKEHLSDPAYYERMSTLLDEIISARKAKAIEYEVYLKRIADVAQMVESGLADDTPEQLRSSPALRALYNNLKADDGRYRSTDRVAEAPGQYTSSGDVVLERALRIDAAVKRARPDGWRGVRAREQIIKAAGSATDEEEIAANRFAAELLMPHDLVAEEVHRARKRGVRLDGSFVRDLATGFGVSAEAMGNRLANLGLVSQI